LHAVELASEKEHAIRHISQALLQNGNAGIWGCGWWRVLLLLLLLLVMLLLLLRMVPGRVTPEHVLR